jgi:hypothetical protein
MSQQFINQAVNLTNKQRVQSGLEPLTMNSQLAAAAQNHTTSMALDDFFSHTGSDGSSMSDRIANQGYNFSYAAENIGVGYANPEAAIEGWMNSTGHRENLLNSNLTEIGVGYYYLENDPGQVTYNHYWTQVFGTSQNSSPPPSGSVYRFYDTITGTHFYTANKAERNDVITNLPKYNYEGASFAALETPTSSSEEVHRFFNTQTGTHFYTISDFEADVIQQNSPQFNYEGTAYHAYEQSEGGTIPLYRFYRSDTGTHFYTPSLGERDSVIDTLGDIYNYEGIAYYVNSI